MNEFPAHILLRRREYRYEGAVIHLTELISDVPAVDMRIMIQEYAKESGQSLDGYQSEINGATYEIRNSYLNYSW